MAATGPRWRGSALSHCYPVQGWVKNLKDGRVQLLVEGQTQDVMKFLTAVRERWKKNIDKELVEVNKPAGEYRKFTIRY